MIDYKGDFSGGLNLDDSYYVMPKNCYIDALNITRDAIAGSNDRSITNVVGNRGIVISSDYELVQSIPGKYYDATITINSPSTISAGTRTIVTLNRLPAIIPTIVLDYTSTQNLSAEDYCNALGAAMISSIDSVSLFSFTGTIANGTYTVSPTSTTGIGEHSSFTLTFSGNVLTTIVINYGGVNFTTADKITFSGALFGGVNTVDDVVLNINSIALPSGILLDGATNNQFYFRYNYNTALAIFAYSWNSYTIHLGRVLTGYTCIGSYPNTIRNTIIYFLYNTQGYHSILEYNIATEITIKILENLVDTGGIDILNFDVNKRIYSINVYNRDDGDLLYFLDTLGRPTGLDIEKFKNGEYTPVSRDIIDVCKRPSLNPPDAYYLNDLNTLSNNLRGKFFKFKYRYIYDDSSRSVCSPISIMPLPTNILNSEYVNKTTNNNSIQLTYNSGDKDVSKIELLMSYVDNTNDWSDFQLIETAEKQLKYTYIIQPIVNTSNNEFRITFGGSAVPGAYVKIYFTLLSSGTEYVEAQEVVSATDTINSFVQKLFISRITFTGSVTGNTMTLVFDPTLYAFSRITLEYQLGVDGLDYNTLFYNNGTYPNIDIQESIQLYDYVPTYAKAQELANGNVLMYGAITEGYNKDTIPNVLLNVSTYQSDVGNTASGNLQISYGEYDKNYGIIIPNYRHGVYYTIVGSPPQNTLIEIYVKDNSNNSFLLTQYTTVNNFESPQTIAFNLLTNISLAVYDSGRGIEPGDTSQNYLSSFYAIFLQSSTYYLNYVKITYPPGFLGIDNPYRTFLNSSSKNIGIAYFDRKGKTNGIIWNEKVTFPNYGEAANKVLLPQIDLTINHTPPVWAHSYQIYLTKNNNSVLSWAVLVIKSEPDYLYFDISTLTKQQELYPTTASVCSWSFREGDRIKIIKNITGNVILSPELDGEVIGIIQNPTVNGTQIQGVTYIKVPRQGAFATTFAGTTADTNRYYIQLYRQFAPDNTLIYYEFGQQYQILFPNTPQRAHAGSSQNQNTDASIGAVVPAIVNIREGDIYFRQRILNFPANPGISTQNIFAYDYNVTDNYISAVSSLSGRPNAIDDDAAEVYYRALVRYGQEYNPDRNINGLPRFYSANSDEYDYNYGDIMRFKARDRFVRVYQKLKVGMVPLYQQMVKNQESQTLVISDKLLNPIQYYVGDVGIGDNPESLASFNYADFFTSNIKGVICRASQDGVEFISITNKINSWANEQVGDLSGRFMVGTFDQRLGNYILALSQSANNSAKTIVYDQEIGNFETFLSYYPEMLCTLGTTLVSFLDGVLYVHNNPAYNTFFGNPAAQSYIKPVFNDPPYQKKTFLAFSEVSSTVWDMPEMVTDINSYGTTKQTSNLVDSDFAQLEGTFEATVKRDINSPGGVLNGDTMKGKYLIPTIRKTSASTLVALNIVSLKYIDSPLTNR